MMELYSHEKYNGYHLFVEHVQLDDDVTLYEGVAQLNGTTVFTSKSLISGDLAEVNLITQIDESKEE